ncbi:MAG: hypothetical protein HY944_00965 [Gemmatimonadetes bacterium]|nr:hypothetical protein [Gemmatimonadota bacterium]
MGTRSPVRRLVLALLAMAHLSVPTLAAVAHARLAGTQASDAGQVRVEDQGRHQSAPAHPESCLFCQLLGRDMLAASGPPAEADRAGRSAPPPAIRQDVLSRTPAARPSSRAPPAQV